MNELVQFVDEVAGVYFRTVLFHVAGTRIPQHVHDYDHATMICSGSARLFVNGQAVADYQAGQVALIKANHHHEFESLEDNTRLSCVHNVASALSMKVKGI